MKPMRRWIILSLLYAFALPALPTFAQDRKSEQAIKHRRAAFTTMSTYFSRLLQTVAGDRPFDAQLVKRDAQIVETLSRLPWEGFAPGTEMGNTRAKEEIWFEEDRFLALQNELQQKTAALAKAANTGDPEQLKIAFLQTREVCNACHKQFRKD